MKKIITILLIMICYPIIAQSGVGINTTTPNSNAILDIESTQKGLLPTRLELVTTDNPSPLTNHVAGIITYNITNTAVPTPVSVYEGLYYNDGTKWNMMGPNTLMLGDIKHSVQTSDHQGWFLLNGRTKTSLPSVAQYNATAVGLGVNLPDASDKFIKTNNGAESQGTTAGNNTITITQANLPNIAYSATTSTDGSHSHSYTDVWNDIKTLGLATNVLPLVPLVTETVGSDTAPSNLFASASGGDHSHTVNVPSGGSGVSIDAKPKHIVTNVFIYLGE